MDFDAIAATMNKGAEEVAPRFLRTDAISADSVYTCTYIQWCYLNSVPSARSSQNAACRAGARSTAAQLPIHPDRARPDRCVLTASTLSNF